MTIYWKAVEQYFPVQLFVFQFYRVCNFRKFIHSGLGTVRSEMVNHQIEYCNDKQKQLPSLKYDSEESLFLKMTLQDQFWTTSCKCE